MLHLLRRGDQHRVLKRTGVAALHQILTLFEQPFHRFARAAVGTLAQLSQRLCHATLMRARLDKMIFEGGLEVARRGALCHLRQGFNQLLFGIV